MSADGKYAHKGDCYSSSSYYLGDDDKMAGAQPILSNGQIMGWTNTNGTALGLSKSIGQNMNYWNLFAKPTVQDSGQNRVTSTPAPSIGQSVPTLSSYAEINNFDAKFQFDGAFVGTNVQYSYIDSGVSVTNSSIGTIAKIQFSGLVGEAGVYCSPSDGKCYLGINASLAEVTVSAAQPVFNTGYYVKVEAGVAVGIGVSVTYNSGVVRADFKFVYGGRAGIGITARP